MGSSASKPLKSAAGTAARRQYPKQPSPSTKARGPETSSTASGPEQPRQPERQHDAQKQGPVYHSQEKASAEKSEGMLFFQDIAQQASRMTQPKDFTEDKAK